MTDVYLLGTNPAERDRLSRTARDLERWSTHLLDRVGVEPGWQAIDVGCGPQGILGLLSERVGPDGRVVGLDVLPEHAAMARAWAAERRLSNVQAWGRRPRDQAGLSPSRGDDRVASSGPQATTSAGRRRSDEGPSIAPIG
jgi:predicted methyltransferase